MRMIVKAETQGCKPRTKTEAGSYPERITFRAPGGTRRRLDEHAGTLPMQGRRKASRSAAARDLVARVRQMERLGQADHQKGAARLTCGQREGAMILGCRTSIFLPPTGDQACPREIRARYALLEASELQTSHDPTRGFAWRPSYNKTLQPRDYAVDKSEQLKVMRAAGCLEPSGMVSTATDGLSGPPVLLPSGLVAGGNGRGMMVQLAHHKHPEQAGAYTAYLLPRGAHFGFCEADVKGMKRPVLVRVLEATPKDLRALGHDLNTQLGNMQDAIRTAVAESSRITPQLAEQLAEVDPDTSWSTWLRANPNVRAAIQQAIPSGFRSAFFDKRGDLTESGQTWLSWALLARLVPDADLIELMGAGLRQSLTYGAPYALGAASAGGAWDVRPHMPSALRILSAMVDQKVSDVTLLREDSLLKWGKAAGATDDGASPTEGATPTSALLAQLLRQRPGPRQQREGWKAYLAASRNANQVNLFGEEAEPLPSLALAFGLDAPKVPWATQESPKPPTGGGGGKPAKPSQKPMGTVVPMRRANAGAERPALMGKVPSYSEIKILYAEVDHGVGDLARGMTFDTLAGLELALRQFARLAPGMEGVGYDKVKVSAKVNGETLEARIDLNKEDAEGAWSLDNPRSGFPLKVQYKGEKPTQDDILKLFEITQAVNKIDFKTNPPEGRARLALVKGRPAGEASKADPKQAERIKAIADKIQQKAEARLEQSYAPQTNTARRAEQQRIIRKKQRRQLSMAQFAHNLAEGVRRGEVAYLGKLSSAAQLESLWSVAWLARYEAERQEDEFFRHDKEHRPFRPSDADLAKMPEGYSHDPKAPDKLKKMGLDGRNIKAAIRELIAFSGEAIKETPAQLQARQEQEVARMGIPGFFPTPPELGRKMIQLAQIDPGMTALEPSAGVGHLADLLKEAGAVVTVVERHSTLRGLLEAKGYTLAGHDALDVEGVYDRIVMNPPYEGQQDIDHIRAAYERNLAPGGRLVSLASKGVEFRDDRKAKGFRSWLEGLGGVIEHVEEGAFKKSDRSTGVNVVIAVIDKPAKATAPAPGERASAAPTHPSAKPNAKASVEANTKASARTRTKVDDLEGPWGLVELVRGMELETLAGLEALAREVARAAPSPYDSDVAKFQYLALEGPRGTYWLDLQLHDHDGAWSLDKPRDGKPMEVDYSGSRPSASDLALVKRVKEAVDALPPDFEGEERLNPNDDPKAFVGSKFSPKGVKVEVRGSQKDDLSARIIALPRGSDIDQIEKKVKQLAIKYGARKPFEDRVILGVHVSTPGRAPMPKASSAPKASPKVSPSPTKATPAPQEPARPAGEPPQPTGQVFAYAATDIPRDLAYRAYTGTSHDPEGRATSEQETYIDHMEAASKLLATHLGEDESNRAFLRELGEAYKGEYLSLFLARLRARDGLLSKYIAGGSNYRHNNKRGSAADRADKTFWDWHRRAEAILARKAKQAPASPVIDLNSPISDADPEAKAKILERIKALENPQDLPRRPRGDLKAKIKRYKERLARLERLVEAESQEWEDGEHVTIRDDVEEGRLQIFYLSKPDIEERTKLKSKGFRWDRQAGAWWRLRGDNALVAARALFPDARNDKGEPIPWEMPRK